MRKGIGLLLLAALLLSGCSNYERHEVPPKVYVGDSRRIAVLFFDNLTDSPALAYEVEQELCAQLSSYYSVTEPREADWALARLGLRPTQVPTVEQAQRLGRLLDVDALLFGEVSGYFEPILQTPPYIVEDKHTAEKGDENRWELAQTTQVMLSFTARLMSTRSGNIIYLERVQAEEDKERKIPLDSTPRARSRRAGRFPR